MKEKEALIVKDDHICPIAKTYCDNECCPVGSICNISSIIEDGISDTLPQTTRTMKQQLTAVEYIKEKLMCDEYWYENMTFDEIFKQAVAMEKEQIVKATLYGFRQDSDGDDWEGDNYNAEKYYNQTFKQEQ